MERLGLSLLPSLKDTDIYAEGETLLTELEAEARLVLSQLADIAQATQAGEKYIVSRVQNLLDAITQAKVLGGGVYVG